MVSKLLRWNLVRIEYIVKLIKREWQKLVSIYTNYENTIPILRNPVIASADKFVSDMVTETTHSLFDFFNNGSSIIHLG